MSNDPHADLIYAILAMDSYNRGYGSGISEWPERGRLGNWLLGLDATEKFGNDAKSAGFYAIAYRNAATGETVISRTAA